MQDEMSLIARYARPDARQIKNELRHPMLSQRRTYPYLQRTLINIWQVQLSTIRERHVQGVDDA